ncbi:MAG: hypothetical protein Fur0040_07050 [Sideroxydans sp.]
MKSRQRGMSFTGFIVGAIVLVLVVIGGLKLVPAYIHSAQISEIFREIVSDPGMRGAGRSAIEMSFRKRASINDINDLNPQDIEIEDDNGTLVLSAHYTLKVPLVGNASLLLEFNPSSR